MKQRCVNNKQRRIALKIYNVYARHMKILVVNKFYYLRGGAELVAIGTADLMRKAGHDVRAFSMDYPLNMDAPELKYTVPEVSFKGTASEKMRGAARVLGLDGLRNSFRKALDEFRPDVVHFHNIHSYLSPAMVEEAHKSGARVLWTLHDYKLVCPSYLMMQPDGSTCSECLTSGTAVLRHRCMKNSLPASALAWLEARRWNKRSMSAAVDAFICPSAFMASKMTEGGFPAEKMYVLSNMLHPEKYEILSNARQTERKNYYCYVGRLSAEKGLPTLIRAASALDMELRIAGSGPMEDELRKMAAPHPQIKFLGKLDSSEVVELLRHARFSVLPSECFENNPLGVIESLCTGTPAVVADIGGIPELINPTNGLKFRPGDSTQLGAALRRAAELPYDYEQIARDALHRFSPATHLEKLSAIYNNSTDSNKK